MRALVKLMLVLVVGFVALMILISVGSIFLALLLPSLGTAIPELGRELGYNRTGTNEFVPLFFNLMPLFAFALMLLFCLAIVVFAMRMIGREPSRARSKDAVEETRLIQELYHGLSRMEQRIESLETLLLDRVPNPRGQNAHETRAQRPATR